MKIYTFNTTGNYPSKTQNFMPVAKTNITSKSNQGLEVIPHNYYRQRFEAEKSLSKINFKSHIEDPKMVNLKKNLSNICKETIQRYNDHDVAISQNLYTRSFVHNGLGFKKKSGDDYHNLKDPFNHEQWSSYYYMQNRTTAQGKSLGTVYAEKLDSKIEDWNKNFIQILSKEKNNGDNNLLDDLLDANDDIEKIKEYLGIK